MATNFTADLKKLFNTATVPGVSKAAASAACASAINDVEKLIDEIQNSIKAELNLTDEFFNEYIKVLPLSAGNFVVDYKQFIAVYNAAATTTDEISAKSSTKKGVTTIKYTATQKAATSPSPAKEPLIITGDNIGLLQDAAELAKAEYIVIDMTDKKILAALQQGDIDLPVNGKLKITPQYDGKEIKIEGEVAGTDFKPVNKPGSHENNKLVAVDNNIALYLAKMGSAFDLTIHAATGKSGDISLIDIRTEKALLDYASKNPEAALGLSRRLIEEGKLNQETLYRTGKKTGGFLGMGKRDEQRSIYYDFIDAIEEGFKAQVVDPVTKKYKLETSQALINEVYSKKKCQAGTELGKGIACITYIAEIDKDTARAYPGMKEQIEAHTKRAGKALEAMPLEELEIVVATVRMGEKVYGAIKEVEEIYNAYAATRTKTNITSSTAAVPTAPNVKKAKVEPATFAEKMWEQYARGVARDGFFHKGKGR